MQHQEYPGPVPGARGTVGERHRSLRPETDRHRAGGRLVAFGWGAWAVLRLMIMPAVAAAVALGLTGSAPLIENGAANYADSVVASLTALGLCVCSSGSRRAPPRRFCSLGCSSRRRPRRRPKGCSSRSPRSVRPLRRLAASDDRFGSPWRSEPGALGAGRVGGRRSSQRPGREERRPCGPPRPGVMLDARAASRRRHGVCSARSPPAGRLLFWPSRSPSPVPASCGSGGTQPSSCSGARSHSRHSLGSTTRAPPPSSGFSGPRPTVSCSPSRWRWRRWPPCSLGPSGSI